MKSHRLLVLLPLLLSGCASDEHQDLRQWMRDEAKGMKGKVAPLPEITPFPVVSYETEMLTPLCYGQNRDAGGRRGQDRAGS